MHIRHFHYNDIPSATTVFIAANQSDTLNQYIFDMSIAASHRARCVRYMRDLINTRGNACLVMCADSNDIPPNTNTNTGPSTRSKASTTRNANANTGTNAGIGTTANSSIQLNADKDKSIDKDEFLHENPVVAFAVFHRNGTSQTARQWPPASSPLERLRVWAENKYTALLPSTDPSLRRANMARIQHILDRGWDTPLLRESWVVEALYVHPNWQRRGISGRLLECVKRRAHEEGVPVVVKGSPVGGLAYGASGFRSLGREGLGEYFDEMEYGGVGHQGWLWEPEGREGEWFEGVRSWYRGLVGEGSTENDVSVGVGVASKREQEDEGVSALEIARDDPLRDDVGVMLSEHVKEQHGNVPAGFAFAMDAQKLATPEISFYTARDRGRLVGMCALKDLGDKTGEVKSLRTASEYRGRGVGMKLLECIISEAKSRGWGKIFLETGRISFYDSAAKLYRKVGFESCGPFADYVESEHNQFFCLDVGKHTQS